MRDYEVMMLRKACEELALRVVFLSSRLDDAELRIEQLRSILYSQPVESQPVAPSP